jgi:preprotein translocase subunit YajC
MFASTAYAQTATPAPGGAPSGPGDLLSSPLVMMIPLIALFYFMIIRPQQKKMKQHQEMVQALKRGDTVVLNSGVIGKVSRVEDAEVQLEIAPNVIIKVVKSMVSEVRTRGETAANDKG